MNTQPTRKKDRASIDARLAAVLGSPAQTAAAAPQPAPQPARQQAAPVRPAAPAAAPAPAPRPGAPTAASLWATGRLQTGTLGTTHLSTQVMVLPGAAFGDIQAAQNLGAAIHAAAASTAKRAEDRRFVLRLRPDGRYVDYFLWLRDWAGIDEPAEYPYAAAFRHDGKIRIGRYCSSAGEANAEAARMQAAWFALKAPHERAGKPWRRVGFAAYLLVDSVWEIAPW